MAAPKKAAKFLNNAVFWAPLFLALYGIWGLFTISSFGVHLDELTQRTIGMENNRFLSGRVAFNKVQEHGLFGPAWESICYLAEQIYFPGSMRFKILLHRVLLWLVFMLSMRSLYRWGLRKMEVNTLFSQAEKQLWSLLPAAFIMLWPRMFADAHYNSKDALFLILQVWVFIGLERNWNTHEKISIWQTTWPWLLLGISCSIRFSGFMIAIFALVVQILVGLRSHTQNPSPSNDKKMRFHWPWLAMAISALILGYVALYPYLWFTGITGFSHIWQFVSNNPWPHASLLNGQYFNTAASPQPWHYVIHWIINTLGEWQWILVIAALCLWLNAKILALSATKNNRDSSQNHLQWQRSTASQFLFNISARLLNVAPWKLFLWLMLLGFLGYSIVFKPVIYNGWRHLYFLILPISLLTWNVIIGNIKSMEKGEVAFKFVIVIPAFWMIWQIVEPPQLHPQSQTLEANEIPIIQAGFASTATDFNEISDTESSLDYWQHTTLQALHYVMEKYPSDTLVLGCKGETVWLNYLLLTPSQQARIRFCDFWDMGMKVGELPIEIKQHYSSSQIFNRDYKFHRPEKNHFYFVLDFNEEGKFVADHYRPKQPYNWQLECALARENKVLWKLFQAN